MGQPEAQQPPAAMLVALVGTALYAGFRANEIVGTDAIFVRETPAQAEVILRSLQSGRFWMVGSMMGFALVSNLVSAIAAWRTRSRGLAIAASVAFALALTDVLITTILQIPNTNMLLSGNIPDWDALRSSWILRDRLRVAVLMTATLVLLVTLVRAPRRA